MLLTWDNPGDRVYQSGLDKGVLYLPDGSAVPWNGLTSVIEHFNKSVAPVYYDGMKIQDMVSFGDFSATMKAITYPEEFESLEGVDTYRRGMFVHDQVPKVFGLCYRTRFGDDLGGDEVGFRLHVLYNVTAIPTDKTYASVSNDPNLVEFEWTLTAVPEETPGYRPTAHFSWDTRDFDPMLLEDLEKILYGSSTADAILLPMPDLVSFIRDWYRVKITDNGDGTWTATADRDGFISFLDGGAETMFQITGVNALYLDDVTFQISDTTDVSQVQQIEISYGLDGAWTASTEQDNLIVVNPDGTFIIYNANAVMLDADTYSISDTTDTD